MTIFQTLSLISALLLIVLLYLLRVYNTIIVKRNQVKTDYSDIDIQLKRRASLIQTLADLVRDYAKHEKTTFEKVSQARSMIDSSRTPSDFAKADNLLTQSLRSLYAVIENYPQLQASKNYRELRQDILQTENLIAHYREEYNRSVQAYNNYIQTFPRLVVAKLFGFEAEPLFQA